jgi:hypothetical protein
MLPSFSRGLRLALVLALSVGYVAWQGHGHSAYAKDGPGDEEGDDDDADSKGKGDETEEDQPEEDKDQPPVTAGGLFTLHTYPVNEILRPLTMTQNIAQVRVGLGTDISDKGAFGTGGLSVEAQYGYTDNFTVLGGLTNAYNFKQFGVYAGVEGSIIYDLLDVRLAANLHRNAIARYCDSDPDRPSNCVDPTMPDVLPNIPDGNYDAGGTKFSIDIGFPFRYAIKPEIAIVALQTLMSIDFNAVKLDHGAQIQENGMTRVRPVPNGAKPDLNPSLGIAINPIPALSVVALAQLRIPDFDTSAGNFQVPLTARVEFSPNQKWDVGLEFTLLNVKPPEGQKATDNRFINLFVQTRIGK